jgi:hypothetical protein
MNIPAASAGAIHAVGTSYHFIMLVAVSIKFFPLPCFWGN